MPGEPLATQDCRKRGSVLPCRLWCSCTAIAVKDLHVHRNVQIIMHKHTAADCGRDCQRCRELLMTARPARLMSGNLVADMGPARRSGTPARARPGGPAGGAGRLPRGPGRCTPQPPLSRYVAVPGTAIAFRAVAALGVRCVAVEDPSSPRICEIAAAAGLAVRALPCDGLDATQCSGRARRDQPVTGGGRRPAGRRLRRICVTPADTANSAAPYGPATHSGQG